jgi:hypothetical protein
MALKQWKKEGNDTWSNKNDYLHEINIRHDAFGYYVLGTGEGSASKRFHSKSEALKFAKQYMRSH